MEECSVFCSCEQNICFFVLFSQSSS
uniref:Uncharacterized protein n=1 Tax=Lepeophtheirus salmonis TaxID=72036 RepID=A0A0K2VL81_LEPSM